MNGEPNHIREKCRFSVLDILFVLNYYNKNGTNKRCQNKKKKILRKKTKKVRKKAKNFRKKQKKKDRKITKGVNENRA